MSQKLLPVPASKCKSQSRSRCRWRWRWRCSDVEVEAARTVHYTYTHTLTVDTIHHYPLLLVQYSNYQAIRTRCTHHTLGPSVDCTG